MSGERARPLVEPFAGSNGRAAILNVFNRTRIALGALAVLAAVPTARADEAKLLIDLNSGQVLVDQNGGHPWHPASLTKMMTAYATLRAIREGRITPDTPITVSANARNGARHGGMTYTRVRDNKGRMRWALLPVGTRVTVENALLFLMVRSANDMAVALGERVGGNLPTFVNQMNAHARRLGMTQTNFVNPSGLPADAQVSSPRDMAILARALIREFPEFEPVWSTPSIRYEGNVIRNRNFLIDRYPGAAGMKTGFVCASGFNLVGVAKRGNRTLIAVVMGADSGRERAEHAAELLEMGFTGQARATGTTLDAMRTVNASPPNLREQVCGRGRNAASEAAEEEVAAPTPGVEVDDRFPHLMANAAQRGPTRAAAAEPGETRRPGWSPLLADYSPSRDPVEVYLGPSRSPHASPILVAGARIRTTAPVADAAATAPQPAQPAQQRQAAAPGQIPQPWAQAAPATANAAAPAALTPTAVRTTTIRPGETGTPAPGIPVPRPRPRS
jgi:D-alanyl-D-alanine carboxypeptidase